MNDNRTEAAMREKTAASQELARRIVAMLIPPEHTDPPVAMITLTAIVIGVASMLCAGSETRAIDLLAEQAKEFIQLRKPKADGETLQ